MMLAQGPALAVAMDPFLAGPLLLEEVLAAVETAYPKLAGALAEREAAAAKADAKRGAFDPVVFAGGDFLRYNSTSMRGKEVTATTTGAGVELAFRSGIKLAAGVNRNAGAIKAPLSSTGELGEGYVAAKVPLLRGRDVNDKVIAEQQALLGIPLASAGIQTTRITVLLGAANSYWEWTAAAGKRGVADELLRIARERAGQIRLRVERGDLPAIDAIEADQEVERRRGGLTKAERDLQEAVLKLGLYLWTPGGTPGALPQPERALPALPEPTPLADETVAAARANARAARPELSINALVQGVVAADRRLAVNDLSPDVSLVMGQGMDLGRFGIGGTLKAGVAFSVPLNRWDAAGRRDEADAKLRKLAAERTLLERQIDLEIDDAASAVRTAQERFRAARAEVDLAQRLEQAERTRYGLGEGTLFLVNQRERSTAETRSRLIEVAAEYHQAIAALRAAAAQL